MKFREWSEIYMEKYVKMRVKQHTYYIYKDIFESHLYGRFGNVEINEITKKDIQDYVDILNDEGYKPATIRLIYVVMKNCLTSAIDEGRILCNPLRKIILPKKKTKPIEIFSREEQRCIEKAIYESNDKRLYGIIIALYTGVRIGELLSLRWENVDFENSIIRIESTVCRYRTDKCVYETLIDSPKTESSRRIIPYGPNIKKILVQLKKDKSDYVISYKNNMMKMRSYQCLFKKFLKKEKIKIRTFHSLRHTYATRSLELGCDIKTLSELLGHRNASTTLNIYSHTLLDTKRKAQEKLYSLSVANEINI